MAGVRHGKVSAGRLAGLAVVAVACCCVLAAGFIKVASRRAERSRDGVLTPRATLGEPTAGRRAAPADGMSGVAAATRRVDRLQGDPVSYRVTVSFPDPEIVAGPDGGAVKMAGQTGRTAPGMPDLPVFAWALPGVPNRAMSVRALRCVDGVSVADVRLAPVPTRDMVWQGVDPPSGKLVSTPDQAVYAQDVVWPADIVTVTEAWMGTRKLARVAVYPVQYNPVRRHLSACREVEFVLEYAPSAHPETQRGPK